MRSTRWTSVFLRSNKTSGTHFESCPQLEPVLTLAHGQQITCFRFERCAAWVVDRVIPLDEIVTFVLALPSTSLLLCASSPDCNPPFGLDIVDTVSARVAKFPHNFNAPDLFY